MTTRKKIQITDEKQETIFNGNIKLQTQTIYMPNGSINIYPYDYHEGNITCNGEKVGQMGRVITEKDGTSHFTPYNRSDEPCSESLWKEKYGELRLYKTQLQLLISVPLEKKDPLEILFNTADKFLDVPTDVYKRVDMESKLYRDSENEKRRKPRAKSFAN